MPKEDWVGVTAAFPLRYQVNARVVVDRGPWQVVWMMRYLPSYRVTLNEHEQIDLVLNQGSSRVAGQDYHDAFARWSYGDSALELGIRNVFNRRASFDAGAAFYSSPRGVVTPITVYLGWEKEM